VQKAVFIVAVYTSKYQDLKRFTLFSSGSALPDTDFHFQGKNCPDF